MQKNKIIIRRAKHSDCEEMMTLIKELATYERAPDAVTVSMEAFEEAGFGKNPIWGAFVAEKDSIIVGLSLYYYRYSTWKGKMLYLEDIVVTETLRGQGIGKLLFDATIAHGREQKCYGMMWQVLKWNDPAINFYKRYNTRFDGEWFNVLLDY